MHSDLLRGAGIDPDAESWAGSPFESVAQCATGEILEDRRNGDLWLLDHSGCDPEAEDWVDVPARRVTDQDYRRMRDEHKAALLADGKYEIARLFGYAV
jgi:hypothetical protein